MFSWVYIKFLVVFPSNFQKEMVKMKMDNDGDDRGHFQEQL
jgi:hypothetical protein